MKTLKLLKNTQAMMVSILLTIFFCWPNILLATDKKQPPIPPAFVETTTIKTSLYSDKISATGTLVSIPGTTIKPEISGQITKVYFKSGDFVQKDTPLIEINPDAAKANLKAASAALQLKRLNFERSQSLYKTKDISKANFDKARANYNAAKAKVDGAKAELQKTIIKSPFAGKLGLSQISEGSYVNIGQNIVNIQTIDPLKVDFSIPEAYQNKIAVDQKILLYTDAYPQTAFYGTVEAFESLINPRSRTLDVRANVPNKDGKLMPGGFIKVTLQLTKQKLIMIPQTSIVYDATGNHVFKVINGKAEKTSVILGKKDSNNVIVKSGLKVGDVIVTSGQMKIYPGSPVIITK